MVSELHETPEVVRFFCLAPLHFSDGCSKRLRAFKVLFLGEARHKDVVGVVDLTDPGILRLFKRVFSPHPSFKTWLSTCYSWLFLDLDLINLLVSYLKQVVADLLYTALEVCRCAGVSCHVL